MRRSLALVTLLAALLIPAGAADAGAPFVARLHAAGHHPKVGRRWPITVTAATAAGRPLSGRVQYEFLFAGRVVARRGNHPLRHGRFTDRHITWPRKSLGVPLTFQVVVTTKLGVVRVPYLVVVRR